MLRRSVLIVFLLYEAMQRMKSTNKVCIAGLGMVSSLGCDVRTSCAAARAGLTRVADLKCMNFQMSVGFGKETLDGLQAVSGNAVSGVGEGFVGAAKIVLLGGAALQDLLRNRPLSSNELVRTGIHLNLSDRYIEDEFSKSHLEELEDSEPKSLLPSQIWVEETPGLIPKILKLHGILTPPEHQRIYYGGHTGIVSAIQDAIEKIERGFIDRCIIGGIESCLEPRFLEVASALNLLKTNDNPMGFIPGEAASFILFERIEARKAEQRSSHCEVMATAIAQDSNTIFSNEPPTGKALYQVFDQALEKDMAAREAIGLIIGDLNGNEHRAMDWGYAMIQLHRCCRIDDKPLWLPAVSFGEVGAATGAVAICMAVRGFERDYGYGQTVLLWLASENGERGAIILKNHYI